MFIIALVYLDYKILFLNICSLEGITYDILIFYEKHLTLKIISYTISKVLGKLARTQHTIYLNVKEKKSGSCHEIFVIESHKINIFKKKN